MAEHELNKIVDDDGEVFNLRDSTKQPTADRVTAWGSTPSDTKYPSEKLVKDSLDAKLSYLDATYMRNNVAGDGWVKLADIGSLVRSSGDINGVWDVVLVVASSGVWRESITLDVRFNASGTPQILLFNRVYENVKKTSFEFCVKVVGLAGSGNSNVELWAKVTKGWYSLGIREAGASNIATKIKWNYYSYSSNGGSSKPVADAGNNIQVADPSYIGGDDFVKVDGGKMTGPLNGYLMSTRATMVGNEYNCLLNAKERGILTFTQSGSGQLTEAQVWGLFDGKIIPQYGTAIDPEDPYILTLDLSSFINAHCQVFSAFGWTCRYWEPLKFKVELYDTYSNVNEWVTICDYSQTQYTGQYSGGGTASLFVKFGSGTVNPHTGVTRGGMFKKIRITIWKGNEGTNRWGISEIFFCYPENYSVYGGLHAYAADKATNAKYADQLSTARYLAVALGNTSTDTAFDGHVSVTNIKTTGTLGVGNGGTGKTSVTAGNYLVGNGTSALTEKTPNAAANDLINALSTGDATPTGEDYYVAQFAGGGTTTKTYHRRPIKALWEYIKSQISSVLGLTATSYGGNAATATTAQNYNTSTGTIKTALDGKRDIYGDFYGEGTSIYGWKIGQMALGTAGSANGYMTAIVRIDRWTKLDNGDRDFDSFFGVVKLWARNSSDGTTTWHKATIHSFKPTAFTSTARGYAIFKKSSNNGHTIDWYIGLAPDSDSTYTPKKEIAYSLIEISPMCEVNFTRGLERVSSDPGFDSWMENCTRGPWLAHNQYGAGSSSLPVYVDADNKVVGVDPKLTQGNLIRSLDVWSNINETDEYIPVANNSATAQYPHGRYSFAKIWSWIKGKLTSDSGVDISGNAATASAAKSGSTLATTLSGKAPTNHASSNDTYGKGTESNYGHVKLDNSALSASSTNTDGVACGKGHTHSQYLTSHQSISGKMNTSADNAASGALQNLTAQLNNGTDAFTDGTELFSSYAGDSGFATTGYVNKPYRRKASAMWSYINSKLVLERSPADVGTSHKRIQLGYGSYGSGVVGYCCYLVHIYFNFVGGTLAGKGVTVLVSYDWRTTTYQSPKCQVLNDNFFSDTGYRIVLANFLSDNNTKLHICLGLVNTSAPTTLVGFAYSYCKIMRVGYGLNWVESIASDDVGTYNYLVQSTYFMETDTNNKIKVVTALPSSPDSNTIYFV